MFFSVTLPCRVVFGFMDDFTQDLKQVQETVQGGRSILAKFQNTIAIFNAQRADGTAQTWQELQTAMSNRLIPELNHCLETIETRSSSPALETQLRSLNPEVTRLIKLLQIDWQFWQAARQADRVQQRQQQMVKHLQQLDQLLEAIGHHLQVAM